MLAYLEGDLATGSQLEWVDRSGKSLGTVGEPQDYTYGGIPEIAPDGRSVLMNILSPNRTNSEVCAIDLRKGCGVARCKLPLSCEHVGQHFKLRTAKRGIKIW